MRTVRIFLYYTSASMISTNREVKAATKMKHFSTGTELLLWLHH